MLDAALIRTMVQIELTPALCRLPFRPLDHVRFGSSRPRTPPCVTDHPDGSVEFVSRWTEDDHRAALFGTVRSSIATAIMGELCSGHD